jgi:hypothetical protein
LARAEVGGNRVSRGEGENGYQAAMNPNREEVLFARASETGGQSACLSGRDVRRLALKVIKLGMDTKQVEADSQILDFK